MGKDLLREFVERGWRDCSVTERYDPYYEPSWAHTESDDCGWDAYDEEKSLAADPWCW